jgi:hypothetical protein
MYYGGKLELPPAEIIVLSPGPLFKSLNQIAGVPVTDNENKYRIKFQMRSNKAAFF